MGLFKRAVAGHPERAYMHCVYLRKCQTELETHTCLSFLRKRRRQEGCEVG